MTHSDDLSPILMVDDDKDDRMMTEKALRKNRVINPIKFLSDGEEPDGLPPAPGDPMAARTRPPGPASSFWT